jgi:ABC-type transport system involved in multi-copper enzyme maturation permease subunit
MRPELAVARCVVKELVRKKDFYVLFMFLFVLLALLSSQTFFHLEGVARYVRDLGYTMVMLFSFIISVGFSAKQIPSEIETKTVYPLLAKPISRSGVVVGKYLGGAAVSLLSFSVFFSAYAAFSILSGKGPAALLMAQAFACGALFLVLTSAMSVFLSTFLTVSANVTFSLIAYLSIASFSGEFRDAVLASKGASAYVLGAFYYLIPHFDFYDLRIRLTHDWEPLGAWVMLALTSYTFVYSFFLLYIAGRIFGRKDL